MVSKCFPDKWQAQKLVHFFIQVDFMMLQIVYPEIPDEILNIYFHCPCQGSYSVGRVEI